ncbi:hypothetical protein [Dactylosporangium sp. CA-233914]|uniref:hypothetical protein n=1 Tax=Dactylosporangium sp. CA-233914 TaxID=3239934 RepID=UPI003D8F283E
MTPAEVYAPIALGAAGVLLVAVGVLEFVLRVQRCRSRRSGPTVIRPALGAADTADAADPPGE